MGQDEQEGGQPPKSGPGVAGEPLGETLGGKKKGPVKDNVFSPQAAAASVATAFLVSLGWALWVKGAIEDGRFGTVVRDQLVDELARAGGDAVPSRKTIEDAVRLVLRENPRLVVEAIEKDRGRQAAAAAERQSLAVAAHKDELAALDGDPVVGAAEPAAGTIIEFFDYRCAYCRRALPTVEGLVGEGKRVIFKEMPILGDASVVAARASLAVWKKQPSLYMAAHKALMFLDGEMSRERVLAALRGVGVDAAAVDAAMDGEDVGAIIARNKSLSKALGINGTPAWVVGGKVILGAVPQAELRDQPREGVK